MIINISEGKINWSQRNNQYIWAYPKSGRTMISNSTMCNVTALCMQHSYNTGEEFPKGSYTQPEDNFAAFMMETPEVLNFYKSIAPDLYEDFINEEPNAYTPNEVHAVLEYAFNLWIGRDALKFQVDLPISTIVQQLKEGKSVTSSGRFPYYSSIQQKNIHLNHINTIVGFHADSKKVTAFIVDDPYGNVHKNFEPGITGNNVIIPVKEFIQWYKPIDDKKVKFGYLSI